MSLFTTLILSQILVPIAQFIILLVMVKYVFKAEKASPWTLIGIVIVAGMIGGFFGSIGIPIYFVLFGVALYKKFGLRFSQIAITLVLILLTLLVPVLLLQLQVKSDKATQTASADTKTWIPFTSAKDQFSVVFPKKPNVSNYDEPLTDKAGRKRTAHFYTIPLAYTVGVYTYLDINFDQTNEVDQIKFIKGYRAELASELPNSPAPTSTVVSFNGRPALSYIDSFVFPLETQYLNSEKRTIIFLKGSRLYVLDATKNQRDNADNRDFFFNSFKLF
ncbi:MAG: hypothetical protein EXS55_00860 [Candidatus Magasanikbacteria bacterium]|nr:hypothetical protein [Candidatus Magasanikbacteria bacterium]